jgi:hypothetical protein
MKANFCADELVLPKSTVTGIAEEISEWFLPSMNEETNFELQQDSDDRKKGRSRNSTVKLKSLGEKLAHWTPRQNTLLEPM